MFTISLPPCLYFEAYHVINLVYFVKIIRRHACLRYALHAISSSRGSRTWIQTSHETVAALC